MNAGIKLILFVSLIVSVFICKNPISFVVIAVFVCGITGFSGISKNVIKRNLIFLSFAVLLPYLFGLAVSELVSVFCYGHFFPLGEKTASATFRILKVIIAGHIGSLYFYSTPTQAIADLFAKLAYPFKFLNLPDYAKTLAIILAEIPNSADTAKNMILKEAITSENNQKGIRNRLNRIADDMVSMIVNSFQKIDRIQEALENEDIAKPQINSNPKRNLAEALIFVLVFALLIWLETRF